MKTIFAKGLYYNAPHEKAPAFVIGSLSVKREEFINFLNEHEPNEKGYLKIDILKSKTGKPYFKLNNWKKADFVTAKPVEKEEIRVEDVPFN